MPPSLDEKEELVVECWNDVMHQVPHGGIRIGPEFVGLAPQREVLGHLGFDGGDVRVELCGVPSHLSEPHRARATIPQRLELGLELCARGCDSRDDIAEILRGGGHQRRPAGHESVAGLGDAEGGVEFGDRPLGDLLLGFADSV